MARYRCACCDIGVGAREIGFYMGNIKKWQMNLQVFYRKGSNLGGSLIRPEATGYGTVVAQDMLALQQKN